MGKEELPLPKGVKRLREHAALIAVIDALPDGAELTTAEAAIYLHSTPKTLYRWAHGYDRKRPARLKKYVGEKGDIVHVKPVPGAPKPTKHVAEGSTARNPEGFWLVEDVRRFKRERRRGFAFEASATSSFAGRLERLTQARPWFAEQGVIAAEATSASETIFDTWARRDGSVELLSLSIVEAMCDFEWQASEARAPWDAYFRDEMRAFAGDAESASAARQQHVMMSEHPARPGGRGHYS